MARSGMSDLITELRGLCAAGTADYTVSGVSYWTDDQLQAELDRRRLDLKMYPLKEMPTYSGGSWLYQEYRCAYGHLEGGTALSVVDQNGNAYGTATYSVDYDRATVTFVDDMKGSAVYINARSYDLDATAGKVWKQKAAHYASAYDFSTDNHSLKRSQLIAQALQMAAVYDVQAGPTSVRVERSDT